MSEKEKIISLLDDVSPDNFPLIIEFITNIKRNTPNKAFGIAHEYANPSLQSLEKDAFRREFYYVMYELRSTSSQRLHY